MKKTIISDTVELDCGVYVNIDELPTQEEYETPFKIWPNPVEGKLQILTVPGKNIVVRIINIQGQQIEVINIPHSGNSHVDTSNWPKGLYMFSLFESGQFLKSVKVVVN